MVRSKQSSKRAPGRVCVSVLFRTDVSVFVLQLWFTGGGAVLPELWTSGGVCSDVCSV